MKSKIFLGLLSLLICININCHIVVADDSSDESYFEMEENSDGEVVLKKYTLTLEKFLKDKEDVPAEAIKSPDVRIPDEVNYIAKDAFKGCILGNVTMSDNVKEIEEFAFSGTRIHNLELSNNITEINVCTFKHCDFHKISLPDNLETIGGSAFESCTHLESIKIPNNVEEINDSAFESCINLKSVKIPNSVRFIGNQAFCHTKLKSVYIPKGVETIVDEAFGRTVIIVGEKNSEAERYAKKNGNIFMTPKEKAFCDKYVNVKSISICMIIIIVIIVIIIKKIKCYKYKNNI